MRLSGTTNSQFHEEHLCFSRNYHLNLNLFPLFRKKILRFPRSTALRASGSNTFHPQARRCQRTPKPHTPYQMNTNIMEKTSINTHNLLFDTYPTSKYNIHTPVIHERAEWNTKWILFKSPIAPSPRLYSVYFYESKIKEKHRIASTHIRVMMREHPVWR